MPKLVVLIVLLGLGAVVASTPTRGDSQTGRRNGRVAYDRHDPASPDAMFVYTANPDGSHAQRLVPGHASYPHWSHDGSRLAVSAAAKDGRITVATVNADGSNYKLLSINDPTLNVGCSVWTPGDTRLACESWDDSNKARNGIYTVSSSDGSGLKRLTNAHGGHDQPGAYSPDGKRLIFARFDRDDVGVGLFVVNANGTHVRRISPPGTLIQDGNDGDWSPQGNEIVFSRHLAAALRGSIWVVRSNGRGAHAIHIRGIKCGGSGAAVGCHEPHWSPDGKKIIFAANSATSSNIYTVNANGTGLAQATHSGDNDDPAWGSHPLQG